MRLVGAVVAFEGVVSWKADLLNLSVTSLLVLVLELSSTLWLATLRLRALDLMQAVTLPGCRKKNLMLPLGLRMMRLWVVVVRRHLVLASTVWVGLVSRFPPGRVMCSTLVIVGGRCWRGRCCR